MLGPINEQLEHDAAPSIVAGSVPGMQGRHCPPSDEALSTHVRHIDRSGDGWYPGVQRRHSWPSLQNQLSHEYGMGTHVPLHSAIRGPRALQIPGTTGVPTITSATMQDSQSVWSTVGCSPGGQLAHCPLRLVYPAPHGSQRLYTEV